MVGCPITETIGLLKISFRKITSFRRRPRRARPYLPAVRPPGSAREERTVHPGAKGLVSLVSWISPLLSEPPRGIACLRAAGWCPALSM